MPLRRRHTEQGRPSACRAASPTPSTSPARPAAAARSAPLPALVGALADTSPGSRTATCTVKNRLSATPAWRSSSFTSRPMSAPVCSRRRSSPNAATPPDRSTTPENRVLRAGKRPIAREPKVAQGPPGPGYLVDDSRQFLGRGERLLGNQRRATVVALRRTGNRPPGVTEVGRFKATATPLQPLRRFLVERDCRGHDAAAVGVRVNAHRDRQLAPRRRHEDKPTQQEANRRRQRTAPPAPSLAGASKAFRARAEGFARSPKRRQARRGSSASEAKVMWF